MQRFSLPFPSESGSGRLDPVHALILLVEDNPADAALVREALAESCVGGELILIRDGERAIRFAEETDAESGPLPDLVILDLNLPRRTGREVLEWLRSNSLWRTIPVIILSSSDAQRDREETARLGADGYFQKPTHLDDFLALGSIFRDFLGELKA